MNVTLTEYQVTVLRRIAALQRLADGNPRPGDTELAGVDEDWHQGPDSETELYEEAEDEALSLAAQLLVVVGE